MPYRVRLSVFKIIMIIAFLVCVSTACALSDSPETATLVGAIKVNGAYMNGVTVAIGSSSATTGNYMGQDGVYVISGLPFGTALPYKASYNGHTITDTVEPISNDGQGIYNLGTQEINYDESSPTPTPEPNATATPTPSPTPAPSPTPTPTQEPTARPYSMPVSTPTIVPTPVIEPQQSGPVATPAPRKVFSSPGWDADHETITATNSGDSPIAIRAWIEDPMNNITTMLEAGSSKNISTPSIMTQDNQIVTVGFDAYENDTRIDSYKAMLSLSSMPSPTTARSPGFASPLAIACMLGAAYIVLKKGR